MSLTNALIIHKLHYVSLIIDQKIESDLAHNWHPFMQMKDFEKSIFFLSVAEVLPLPI